MKHSLLALGLLVYLSPLTYSSVITDNFPWIFTDCNKQKDHMEQYRCMISKFKNPDWIEDSHDNNIELRVEQKFYWHPNKRVRRECRAIPREEWIDLVNAINTLKNDTSLSPNVYDYFANFHRPDAIHHIHYGSNFFGWHRIFILKFEELLRKINPNITLCFWDSRLDSVLPDDRDSIMFTEMFMGNVHGPVTKGPFAGWKTIEGIPLERHIGRPGYGLVTPGDIERVLSKKHHFQIATPTADGGSNMELIHNGVHGYIGGQMSNFGKSSQDPFFWIHHAFIDSIWEKFCAKLKNRGIDPQDDYANVNNVKHDPDRPMVHLGPFKNIDGYSEYFTNNIMDYGEYATCPDCLGSPYLKCDTAINKCRAITKNERPRFQNVPKRIETNHLSKPKDKVVFLSGDENIDKWVFVPIKIVFRNGIRKTLSNINITGCEYGNTYSDICSKSVAIVQSNGITYHGNYRNYIINDVRIPQWSYAFVAVRNPDLGPSQSLVSITDKMGYPCAAYCLNEHNNNYNACPGVISLTNDEPKMFSETIDNAKSNDFHFEPLKADAPDIRIKMLFTCY